MCGVQYYAMGLGGVVGMHVGFTPLYSDFHLWEEEGEKKSMHYHNLGKRSSEIP